MKDYSGGEAFLGYCPVGQGKVNIPAILDMMEREGLIGQADGSRPRPVLGKAYEMVAEWDEISEME